VNHAFVGWDGGRERTSGVRVDLFMNAFANVSKGFTHIDRGYGSFIKWLINIFFDGIDVVF